MSIFSKIRSFLTRASGAKPVWNTYNIFGVGKVFVKKDYYYGIAYSCIDAIANNVATTNFSIYQELDDDRKELPNHPALKLLYRPNPFMTGVDLLYLISSHIDAFGKAFLYPVKSSNGAPVEIWALDPARMRTIYGPNFISGFVYMNPQGELIPFEPNELIEIKRPNPFQQQDGISTIEMARFAVEGDYGAQIWNNNFFNNGAMPSGILTTEGSLSEEAFQRLKTEFHDTYEGSNNAYKTLIVEGGLTYQQVQLKQKDMDFLNQRKFNRDEILSIFKVPKPIIAIADDVNRANAETAEYVFAKRVVKPRLELIFEKLNQFYLPMFKGTENLDLDFDDPVPSDEVNQMNYYSAATNVWMTINEVRAEEGLDPITGGDVIYLNNLQSQIVGSDNTPPEDGNTDPEQNPETEKAKVVKKSVGDKPYLTRKRRYLEKSTKQLQNKLNQHFKALVRDIRNHKPKAKTFTKPINKKGISQILDDVIPNLTSWKSLYATILFEANSNALNEAGDNASTSYNLPPLKPESAIDYLRTESQKAADDQENTILDRSRQIIADQLANDVTDLETIQNQIADTLGQESDWRVERIARTELSTAYHEGAMMDFADSSAVEQVKWIVNQPTDDACIMNADQVVNIGDSFPSGDDQPPVHPNCECDIVPYFGD